MKNGICPKCDGREIYHTSSKRNMHEAVALTHGVFSKGAIPSKYVCAHCGYLEYYLPVQEHIDLLRENWERVS